MDKKFEQIIKAFKDNGGRITDQRKLIFQVILENPGCSCKEFYYLAKSKNQDIGKATVYKIVKDLMDFGFI